MYNKYQAFLVAKITYFKNIIMNAFVRMTTKYESSFQKKTKTVIFPTTWFIHQTSFLHSMKRHLVANPTKYHCSIILPFLSSSFRTTYYIVSTAVEGGVYCVCSSLWQRTPILCYGPMQSLKLRQVMCVKVHGNSSITTS